MTNKGFTLTELLVSFAVLSIIMVAAANFTLSTFQTSYNHSLQVQKTNNTRFSAERVFDQLSFADYIYPAGKTLSLIVNKSNLSINTNNAIAYLISDRTNSSPPKYFFKSFYIVNEANSASLYEFSSENSFEWQLDTLPNINSICGNSTKIATNISKTDISLNYILNYENGITDSILEGEISGITSSDEYALIKGVEWKLTVQGSTSQSLQIKGLSNNVPRFIE